MPVAEAKPTVPGQRLGFHPDDTTPIPRPSRFYGREEYAASRVQAAGVQPQITLSEPKSGSSEVSIVPAASDLLPTKIDKSTLTIAEPKRLRDKAHLKFVASQPCLICGRRPSDPHHLRFAQPRAIGMKVSDEFTVPLCRGHHRQLHQAGNEIAWWEDLDINALEIAKALWEENRRKSAAVDLQTPSNAVQTDKTTTGS
jgi:hypothetical protein